MPTFGEGDIVGGLSWLETIGYTITGVVVGLGGGYLKWRSKYSALSTELVEGQSKREVFAELKAERAELRARVKEAETMLHEASEKRSDLAATAARLDALLQNAERRATACEDRSSAADIKLARADERARGLTDDLLASHMWNNRIMAEIMRLDPKAAQHLLLEQAIVQQQTQKKESP